MKAARTNKIYETNLTQERPTSKFKRIKSKIMRQGEKFISEQIQQASPIREEQITVLTDSLKGCSPTVDPLTKNIFPCLDGLNNSLTNLNLKYQPPPTYSDSESAYNDLKYKVQVLPSAPEQSFSTIHSETTGLNDYYNELPVKPQEAYFMKEEN